MKLVKPVVKHWNEQFWNWFSCFRCISTFICTSHMWNKTEYICEILFQFYFTCAQCTLTFCYAKWHFYTNSEPTVELLINKQKHQTYMPYSMYKRKFHVSRNLL